MSNTALPPVPSPEPAPSSIRTVSVSTPDVPRASGGSGFGWVATILGLLVGMGLLIVKIYSVATTGEAFVGMNLDGLTLTLAVLGFLSIVLIIIAIVLGHVGVARAGKAQGRGAAISGFALGGSYLLLVLWIIRLVAAVMSAAMSNDWSYFLQDTVWWA